MAVSRLVSACAVALVASLVCVSSALATCDTCLSNTDTMCDLACQLDDVQWDKWIAEEQRSEVEQDILVLNYCIVLLYQIPEAERDAQWSQLLEDVLAALIPLYETRDTLVATITGYDEQIAWLQAEIERLRNATDSCDVCNGGND